VLARFAANKYKSHRGIPSDFELDKIVAECAKKMNIPAADLLSTVVAPVPPPAPVVAPAALVGAPVAVQRLQSRWKNSKLQTTSRPPTTAMPYETGTSRAACRRPTPTSLSNGASFLHQPNPIPMAIAAVRVYARCAPLSLVRSNYNQ
jgi:hypothetical protein